MIAEYSFLCRHAAPSGAWRDDYLLPAARKHEFLKVSFSQIAGRAWKTLLMKTKGFSGHIVKAC
ncbi:hypothetical protein [Komagataeibacter xylinus]|uniref:hypothetical protein n=1 Tax=Komagataeibacter xylinus TaxID=28448 RepID=UPI00280AFE84|nr:hypothetical protein [Komagataeibacter xylinus]